MKSSDDGPTSKNPTPDKNSPQMLTNLGLCTVESHWDRKDIKLLLGLSKRCYSLLSDTTQVYFISLH